MSVLIADVHRDATVEDRVLAWASTKLDPGMAGDIDAMEYVANLSLHVFLSVVSAAIEDRLRGVGRREGDSL